MNEGFRNELRDAIKEKGYTQADFAKISMVSTTHLLGMLNGTKKVSKQAVAPIKEILGLEVPAELIAKAIKSNKAKIQKNNVNFTSYDSKTKQAIRHTMVIYIKDMIKRNPFMKVLTLPSHEGLCVKAFQRAGVFEANIDCVERDKRVLMAYEKLGFQTNNFHTTVYKHLAGNLNEYDLLFLDFCGTLGADTVSSIFQAGCYTKIGGVIGITLNICHRLPDFKFNKDLVSTVVNKLDSTGGKFTNITTNYYKDNGKNSDMVFLLFERVK